MKKAFVILGLVLAVLIFIVISTLSHPTQGNLLSDNELIEMYLTEQRGNGTYDVFIQDGTNEDDIYYIAYDEGKFCDCGMVNRSYCKYIVNN